MNSSACILLSPNPQELAQKQLESQSKKKQINHKYYQNKKQELDELNKIKVQLGVKHVDFDVIQKSLLARDQIISSLQIENQTKQQEYTNLLREKDAEIERMRIELENERRDNSREKIIADVGQQLGLMNQRIGKLELCENRVKKLEVKLLDYEGRYYFVERMLPWHPNAISDTIIRLQNERLSAPLQPSSLDKLIANSRPIVSDSVLSPTPIPQQPTRF